MLDVIILAAGYATRLYPLTLNQPKPLLPVWDRPILDHIVDRLEGIEEVSSIYVVTNHFFYNHFKAWSDQRESPLSIHICDDGTKTKETRLGAIRDIQFVIDQNELSGDLLVIAGDNLFEDDLQAFVKKGLSSEEALAAVYDLGDKSLAHEYGVVSLKKDGRIDEFVEKSMTPPSALVATCIYCFPKRILPLLKEYILLGENLDAPGHFLKWLVREDQVGSYVLHGAWYDIGSQESYEAVQKKKYDV